MSEPKELRMVRVDWVDSATHVHGWCNIEEIEFKALECVTVGILVRESKVGITISHSMTVPSDNKPVPDVCDTFDIPRGCIRKITPLRSEHERSR